jgi:hypothetical protein
MRSPLASSLLCRVALSAALLIVGACDQIKPAKPQEEKRESVLGEGGIVFGGNRRGGSADTSGIGVNSFLWRATLDTIGVLPLESADPFGGVIITDWYTPPGTTTERLKLNVFLLGKELRADAVRISVFRQQREGATSWRDVQAAPGTASQLEDAILTRARQLRVLAQASQ